MYFTHVNKTELVYYIIKPYNFNVNYIKVTYILMFTSCKQHVNNDKLHYFRRFFIFFTFTFIYL